MNIIKRLKAELIKRSLDKRRLAGPFMTETAEHFSLPPNADANQNNSYYFSGHDIKGESLLFRFAKRGLEKTEVWFAYRGPDGTAYINEIQLFNDEVPAGADCIEAGKAWEFFWNGDLEEVCSGRKTEANFSGKFRATGGIFEFGHDVDSRVMARAIAEQKWSRAFFSELKANDQIHYEQSGVIEGTLSIGDKKFEVSLPAMRDHSFGKRDWNYMDRHFWLMALFQDGSSLNANMVSYPLLQLETGYFISRGETACVESAKIKGPIEPNAVPENFIYEVKLTDGNTLEIECEKEVQFVFPMNGGEYTIFEGVGSFKLNGEKARGILEFGWNRDASRYASYGGLK